MIRRLAGWVSGLPPAAIAFLALLGAAGVATGGYYAFQTYDYIEHDNEFCLSCHLMREPYDRFAESEHRGLGCKACHKPTFAARSQMALTQILENPGEIASHAEVPNEKCASCHVEGDPEKWTSIRSSAGHRIHFESQDTALQGLLCVECHSTSVHEFAPSDRTCAQSGCHTDQRVRLGGMSDLTIHCAACHAFNAPVAQAAPSEALFAAVRPEADECLSCHTMRTLMELPADEPHNGACGACHNPHEQTTPEQAVESCATVGCHEDPAREMPFHRGLEAGVLENCTTCHEAHGWKAEEGRCLACHETVLEVGGPPGRAAAAAAGLTTQDTTFRHTQHRQVDCRSCHAADETHGGVTVLTLSDCRSCHHSAPVARDCTACHAAGDGPSDVLRVRRTLALSVGTPSQRALPFDHDDHRATACGECHTEGLALSAETASCDACHQEHHRLGEAVRCASCHVSRREEPHTADVHRGCTGARCHQDLPFEGVPRDRSFCLVCHQDMEEHRPGRPCEQCHSLPEPRGGGGDP